MYGPDVWLKRLVEKGATVLCFAIAVVALETTFMYIYIYYIYIYIFTPLSQADGMVLEMRFLGIILTDY